MTLFELDITREHCPMTFVKTKLKLESMASGDQLTVHLRAGEPLENVPKTAMAQGHAVIAISHEGDDVYRVVIKKG